MTPRDHRCALKAGHAGPCRWVTRATARRRWGAAIERGITPSEPPCIQSLMLRREREVREGKLA
jgi:hypothetical protein